VLLVLATYNTVVQQTVVCSRPALL